MSNQNQNRGNAAAADKAQADANKAQAKATETGNTAQQKADELQQKADEKRQDATDATVASLENKGIATSQHATQGADAADAPQEQTNEALDKKTAQAVGVQGDASVTNDGAVNRIAETDDENFGVNTDLPAAGATVEVHEKRVSGKSEQIIDVKSKPVA